MYEVLGARGRIRPGQDAAGVVVGHVGDNAAPVRRLGDEATIIAHIIRVAAAIRPRHLGDLADRIVLEARHRLVGTGIDRDREKPALEVVGHVGHDAD